MPKKAGSEEVVFVLHVSTPHGLSGWKEPIRSCTHQSRDYEPTEYCYGLFKLPRDSYLEDLHRLQDVLISKGNTRISARLILDFNRCEYPLILIRNH
jgi:hypothetical protein